MKRVPMTLMISSIRIAMLTLAVSAVGFAPCMAQPQSAFPRVGQLAPPIAIPGQPFGVFSLEVPLPNGLQADRVRVLIDDANGRIFYPTTAVRTVEVSDEPAPPALPGRLRSGGLIDRLRNVIRADKTHLVPVAITVAGLFRGDEPLDIHLIGDIDQQVQLRLSPERPGATHAAVMAQWWGIYAGQAERAEKTGDYPLLMHKYLVHMLSQRLQLPWPLPVDPAEVRKPAPKKLVEPLGTLSLLSGIEPLRDEILDRMLLPPMSDSTASLPVPAPPAWKEPVLPVPPADVEIESLAERVPPECFYLRFGSFRNYLWFQDLSARSGGDLAQIVLVRGFNYETSRRMERMLNTRMTAVAKMFGDSIISDMAIIGRDLYMKEGASLGVLFSSQNPTLLMSSMQNERKQALGKVEGATMQTIQIEGQDVSLLSTPDNRIRSFLVADGQHVLLTTSRTLVERFIQIGAGETSMAQTDGFRWSRVWMPHANDYSVFGYFSPEFFHGLVSPEYQIELQRRLEAIAHLEVAEVATRAALAEGIDPELSAMVSARLLPPWFDQRADGSQTLRADDRWLDSSRGARGSFLPIIDAEIGSVSAAEADRYAQLANFYETKWQQMDPMLIGLRRFQVDGDPRAERIGIEGYLSPFGREKYGWIADMLAPAAPVAIATPGDDVISVQALMNGSAPLTTHRQPYHLFAGVKDMNPPAAGDSTGLIQTFRALKSTPGYLGAFPRPGYLDQLPLGLGGGRPDPAGFSRSFIGLWRWQNAGFSVLSFDRSILENTSRVLTPTKADDSAQVRLNVRDLAGSKLSGWVNQQWYQRASRASHGNAALLDSVHQQLKVPGPDALQVTETMLDVKLNCPLGGTFAFVPQSNASSQGSWVSSAWASERQGGDGQLIPPQDYMAPWLQWFRGAQLHLTQFPDRVAVVGTFDVQRQAPVANSEDAEIALPSLNFDLFQLPFKMFGGGDAAAPAKPEKRSF